MLEVLEDGLLFDLEVGMPVGIMGCCMGYAESGVVRADAMQRSQSTLKNVKFVRGCFSLH